MFAVETPLKEYTRAMLRDCLPALLCQVRKQDGGHYKKTSFEALLLGIQRERELERLLYMETHNQDPERGMALVLHAPV